MEWFGELPAWAQIVIGSLFPIAIVAWKIGKAFFGQKIEDTFGGGR